MKQVTVLGKQQAGIALGKAPQAKGDWALDHTR